FLGNAPERARADSRTNRRDEFLHHIPPGETAQFYRICRTWLAEPPGTRRKSSWKTAGWILGRRSEIQLRSSQKRVVYSLTLVLRLTWGISTTSPTFAGTALAVR